MRFAYKPLPAHRGDPDWLALVWVQIANPLKHSPPTKRFEAIIDSGASRCLFHSSLAQPIGLDLKKGEEDATMGVDGKSSKIYLHKISLHVMGNIIRMTAGFSEVLPLGGILGRIGFFESFKITFDPSTTPPGFELEQHSQGVIPGPVFLCFVRLPSVYNSRRYDDRRTKRTAPNS